MEGLVTLGVASIAAFGSIATAWAAARVHKNTKPISNGFAGDALSRLARIEQLIVDHIASHADNDVRKGGTS
jgi:hypothetical protein